MSRSCSKSIRRTPVLLSGKVSLLAGKTIVDKATRVSYNFISDTHDAENGDTIWEKKVKKPNS